MPGIDVRLPQGLPTSVVFHPVVDLDTGTVVAIETHIGPAGASVTPPPLYPPSLHDTGSYPLSPDQAGPYSHPSGPYPLPQPVRFDPVEEDIRRAVQAAWATAESRTPLPLQLILRAETVAVGQTALSALHNGLRDAGRRPHEVIVCMSGGFAPAQRPAVSAALHGLRSAGYLVGFAGLGTTHSPLDLLVDGTPYLVKIDPELARQAATDPRRSALVEALVGVAHRVGTHVQAPGVTTEDQLAHLRELGVRLVQGPLLADPGWRPGMRVSVPVPVRKHDDEANRSRVYNDLGPRVSEFTLPAVTMGLNATADQVLTVLNAERGTTSVVLVDEQQRPRHTVDRTRFLLAISGAYGHALHAHKPAARLADPPRLVPKTVPAIAALRAAGEQNERVYDDLVVTDELGRCLGILRVSDLIRSLSPGPDRPAATAPARSTGAGRDVRR